MNSFKMTLIASGLFVSAASIAVAADTWTVPSKFQEQVSAMLTEQGYTLIRASDTNETRLVAVDTEGSEVILTMHRNNGTIAVTEYVYSMDR